MEALYQILTFVFGGTSVVGTVLSIIWWKQTKRLKEAEVKNVEETSQGVTVGMGAYKPIPRFRGGCNNC